MNEQEEKLTKTKREMNPRKGQDPRDPEPSFWSQLPATVVTFIYKCLADVDRVSMARVCKSWSQVFRDPALWRSRTILFGARRTKQDIKIETSMNSSVAFLKSNGRFATRFARQFPTALQDIEIDFMLFGINNKEVVRDFKEFSACLANAKLRNICIYYLELDLVTRRQRIDLIKSLNRLLHNQTSLRKFRMESTRVSLESGLQILRCVPEASAATIEDLTLFGFLDDEVSVPRDGRLVKELQNFTGLSSVHLDYNLISESLVTIWARGCPNLTFIELWVDQFMQCSHVISCEAWESLVSAHPNLLVELTVFDIGSTNQMLDILSPEMPMFKLDWNTDHGYATDAELTNALHRIASYHRTIKHFRMTLVLAGQLPSLDTTAVQNIFSKCAHLLPLTCKNVSDPETGENTLTISQSTPWREKFYY